MWYKRLEEWEKSLHTLTSKDEITLLHNMTTDRVTNCAKYLLDTTAARATFPNKLCPVNGSSSIRISIRTERAPEHRRKQRESELRQLYRLEQKTRLGKVYIFGKC